jgi:micrococcal nuclease
MSRQWRPQNSPWLSPEAYDALSPAEKRALWRERQTQRQKRKSSTITPANWLVVAGIFAAVWAYEFGLSIPSVPRQHSAPVTAEFGYCKWGGGTNCVVDGDTFYLNGDKVRIAGIDAPETHDYGCPSELALGNQATEMLHQLLNSGAVTMTSIDRDRDVYGRLLRNVAVNGQDVGEAMVSAGVARDYGSGRRPWC